MNKRDRQTLARLGGFTFLVVIFLIRSKFNNPYVFLGLLIFGTAFVVALIESLIPVKSSTRKRQSPQKKISESKKGIKTATGKYGVRSDHVILQTPLEHLSGLEFEQLVYLYLKSTGWQPIKTPEAKDGGVDIVVTNKADGLKIAVQVKHYYRSKSQVTVKDIRELDSAKKNHGCIGTWFITSGTFTNAALVEADMRKMRTSDITYVETKILPWREHQARKHQKSHS
ncbi:MULTISPECIES: restriction endonuclease [Geobacillus]|uniref:restriction endonuclease n=1 Tax=Geobacillus TaxID=129337 RepID=UPI0004738DAE|nr:MULTISPECIES: restriction endonuclease [Geobacillus]